MERQTVSNWLVEKSHSYIKQHEDRFACKAFLLTAKTIYPQDFEIQYEAYCLEKSAQNVKQAASLLLEMFCKFKQQPKMLSELKAISKSLQGDSTDGHNSFLKDVYEQLPTNIQKEILSLCIEQCPSILETCRLRLLLLQGFSNKGGHEEAISLIETLLSTEKSEGVKHVINPYRRLMVYKILPYVLSMDKFSRHCSTKQCSKWLQKTIEFFVTMATQSQQQQQQQKLPVGERLMTSAGGEGAETMTESGSPWDNLHHVLKLVARSNQWESGFLAPSGSGLGETWSIIQKHMQRHHGGSREGDAPIVPKAAFYTSLVLLLRASHRYASLMSPQLYSGTASHHHQPQVLLEDLEPKKRSKKHKHTHKKRRHEGDRDVHNDSDGSDDVSDMIQPTEMTPLSVEITEAFHTAVNCWQLLNSCESSLEDLNWLLKRWAADSWSWLNSFQSDRLFHSGESGQAIAMLQTMLKADQEDSSLEATERMKLLVQLASIYHSMGRLADACDCVLQAISILKLNYVEGNPSRGIVSEGSLTGAGRSARTLHILSASPTTLLPYCIQLVLLAFKKRVLHRADSNDTGLGHLIVLMQYNWPKDEQLFNEAVRRIRKQGSFSYHTFFNFIINIDLLEEFAHLKTEDGGKVNLDILPSAAGVQRQRTVTRGVTRGGKEDFRAAMERQVMRSHDNIEAVIVRFLTEEKESIKFTFADS